MSTSSRSKIILALPAAAIVLTLVGGSGCMRQQMARRTVSESKQPAEVLKAAEDSIRAKYYQVKVYPSSNHIIALTPIRVEGNQPVRKKIDVWVFQENGYYMPKVFVRRYVDLAEPEQEKGGPIAGRFPIEVGGHPAAGDDWHPLYYDRTEEEELRDDILMRLKILNIPNIPS